MNIYCINNFIQVYNMFQKKKFEYLYNQNTLEPIPILINMLELYKDKLKKYKCLEIGGGNLHRSIPNTKYFKSYDVIEPNVKLYEIAKINLNKFESNIKLHCNTFYNFLETTNIKFDIIIFINSIHFIDIQHLQKYIGKCKYFIVVHPLYNSNIFADTRLNRGSENFDEELWNKEKIHLEKYELFIKNYKVIFEDSNKFRKIFFCKTI